MRMSGKCLSGILLLVRPLWFKAKRYGYGWYPATWQGWPVTLAAVAIIVVNAVFVDRHSHSVSDTLIGSAVPTIVVVALLILTCILTGEKPRWRWGGK